MFRREEFEGTEVRSRMETGGDWRSLVPDPVVDVVEEIDGIGRIRQVTDTDANGTRE
jgi:nicotinamide-nucleotide adenylyltransferase